MDIELEYEDVETIILDFEDGESQEFEIVGTFEHEGCSYIALMPFEEDEDEEGEPLIYLYACTIDDDGLIISEIESDDLYDAVAKTFEELSEGIE